MPGQGSQIHVGHAFTRSAPVNGWDPANASEFKLRGSQYLTNRVKSHSEPSAFRLVGVSRRLVTRYSLF